MKRQLSGVKIIISTNGTDRIKSPYAKIKNADHYLSQYKNIHLKSIIDRNIRAKTINVRKENKKKTVTLKQEKIFFKIGHKNHKNKRKNHKLDFVNIKAFFSFNGIVKIKSHRPRYFFHKICI